MRHQRGMTLVEVSAAILISTVILGMLFLLVERSLKDWYAITEETELRNEANAAMRSIQDDLNQAVSLDVITPKQIKISVKDKDGLVQVHNYEFRQDGFYCNNNRVSIRSDDFSQSSFTKIDDAHIKVHIQITGIRGQTFSADTYSRYQFRLDNGT